MAHLSNQKYYGSTVIGEKGQIVIPAQARKAFRLNPGDRVMVFGNEYHGRMIIMRADVVAEYISRGLSEFGKLARMLDEEPAAAARDAPPHSTTSPAAESEG